MVLQAGRPQRAKAGKRRARWTSSWWVRASCLA